METNAERQTTDGSRSGSPTPLSPPRATPVSDAGARGAFSSAIRRARPLVASVCTLAAMYLAFAVGAPWLIRDAPPDAYAIVATHAK